MDWMDGTAGLWRKIGSLSLPVVPVVSIKSAARYCILYHTRYHCSTQYISYVYSIQETTTKQDASWPCHLSSKNLR